MSDLKEMSGLTRPIDVTRPEDYQLRDGSRVLALAKCKGGDIFVVYGDEEEPFMLRVNSKGKRFNDSHKELDLIEKPKKMWRAIYDDYRFSHWFDSKSEADINAGGSIHRVGYLVCTDRADFSTYELVPLDEEV